MVALSAALFPRLPSLMRLFWWAGVLCRVTDPDRGSCCRDRSYPRHPCAYLLILFLDHIRTLWSCYSWSFYSPKSSFLAFSGSGGPRHVTCGLIQHPTPSSKRINISSDRKNPMLARPHGEWPTCAGKGESPTQAFTDDVAIYMWASAPIRVIIIPMSRRSIWRSWVWWAARMHIFHSVV